MRLAWAAAIVLGLVPGCGRIDFAPIDASADAPPFGVDSDPSFVVIETLTVPVDGSSVSSTTILASSDTYRLNASGAITVGGVGDMRGDAEYHDFSNPTDTNNLNGQDYGISIDHPVIGQKVTRWGPYVTSHIYETDFTGRDQTLSANLHDGDYANNIGTLTLKILRKP
jgi:hypothetical protein